MLSIVREWEEGMINGKGKGVEKVFKSLAPFAE